MSRRIAIVEDDPAIRANYADVLRRQGYEVAVHPDRAAAMLAFRTRLPDLAVVDIGLGDEIDGGFTLCRDLRGLSATLPIIFLTARDSEFDTVSGLRSPPSSAGSTPRAPRRGRRTSSSVGPSAST